MIRVLLLLLLCMPTTVSADGYGSDISPSMVGISLNNLLWSNSLGPVLNYERGLKNKTALKVELGYYLWKTRWIEVESSRFPEHLQPDIKRFNGYSGLIEYKRYLNDMVKPGYYNRYISAYYTHRVLRAEGDMIVTTASETDLSYRAYLNTKRENINELGIKYGWIKKLAQTQDYLVLLDIYLGIGYQFTATHNTSEASKHPAQNTSYTSLRLKNFLHDRNYDKFPASQNYSAPIFKFGININIAK